MMKTSINDQIQAIDEEVTQLRMRMQRLKRAKAALQKGLQTIFEPGVGNYEPGPITNGQDPTDSDTPYSPKIDGGPKRIWPPVNAPL